MRRLSFVALTALIILSASAALEPAAASAAPSAAPGPGPAPAAPSTPAAATSGTSRFVPVSPTRVLDTRLGLGPWNGVLPPGGTVTMVLSGRGGVPASGATAVLLNVTLAEAVGPGFVQVYPTGQAEVGASSNLNVEYVGQTIPNLVIAPWAMSIYTQGGGHLIADVFGYFTASSSSAEGRYVPVFPNRLLDTRAQQPGKLGAGGSVRVQIVGRGGVPSTGATAVVVNVTATEASDAGFVQVLPTGQAAFGTFSNLNLLPGQTIPNLVVVPVGADGSITVFSQRGAHVVVDVFGYFTNQTAPESADGLFVPISPARLLDTRHDPKPVGGSLTTVAPAGHAGIPTTGVAAVFANLTATEASGAGYLQLVPGPPTGAAIGYWSNANVERAGQTIPNAGIANLGNDGTVLVHTLTSTHIVLDTSGYFTGATSIVNHPPALLPVDVWVTAGQSIDINVLDYASEPDGDPMTVTGFGQPADGTVAQLSVGTIRYSSFVGPDRVVSFPVSVSDNRGATATATVTVHVTSGVVPSPCAVDLGGSGAHPAEDAVVSGPGSAGVRCVNSGFRGRGYIGDWNGSQAVTFAVYAPTTGSYDVAFRYQNATATSTRQLAVPNGTTTITFANTHGGDTSGNWANGAWSETTANVWLEAGSNAVTLFGGSGFVDLDEVSSVTAHSSLAPLAPSELVGTPLNWTGNGPSNGTSSPLPIATIRLEWRDNAGNESGFRVYQAYGGATTLLTVLPANTTSATIQQAGFDAAGGGGDLLYVVAFNAAGESARTSPYDVFAPVPAAPQLISHVRVDNSACGAGATDCRQLRFRHTSTLGWTTYNFGANVVLFGSGVFFVPNGSCFGTTCDYTVTLDAGAGGLGANPNCISITGVNSGRRNLGPASNTICLSGSNVRTFEAEQAGLSGSPAPVVSSENPGFSGSGYVGVFGYTGQRITFTVGNVGDGQSFLSVRSRAIETGVVRSIYVNGSYVGGLALPRTANAWTDDAWASVTFVNAISLRAGSNTIVIEYSGSGGVGFADIDSITLT